MYCKSINIKYRNTKTTIYTVLLFLFIIWFLNLLLPLDSLFDNKYYILISYLALNVIEYWKYYYDPTELCDSVFKTNCKRKKFILTSSAAIIVSIVFLFFALQLFIKSIPICLLIIFIIVILKLKVIYSAYKQDELIIINNESNIFRCQRVRILFNVILLFIRMFMYYKIIKEFNIPFVLKHKFNLNDVLIYILSIIYILTIIITPLYLDVDRVDQSVKYNLDEIKLT
jgi:hypothetical protein